MTVDPNLAIAVNAIKLNKQQLPFCSVRHRETLAVPTQSARQCAAADPGGMLFAEFAFNAPVVRQVQLSPLRIVEARIMSIRDVAEFKAPILIKQHSFSRARIRR